MVEGFKFSLETNGVKTSYENEDYGVLSDELIEAVCGMMIEHGWTTEQVQKTIDEFSKKQHFYNRENVEVEEDINNKQTYSNYKILLNEEPDNSFEFEKECGCAFYDTVFAVETVYKDKHYTINGIYKDKKKADEAMKDLDAITPEGVDYTYKVVEYLLR